MQGNTGSPFIRWIFDQTLGRQTEVNPNLQGIDKINAERPNKGLPQNAAAWLLWVAPVGLLAILALSITPPIPLLGEALVLFFGYAVTVRTITQMNERFTRKLIIQDMREEARFRGVLRISLGLLLLCAAIRLVGWVVVGIDNLGQPASFAQFGIREYSLIWSMAVLANSLGVLFGLGAAIGLSIAGVKVGRRYALGRRNAFTMIRRFSSKDGILGFALGIPVTALENEQSITFDGEEIIIDPVPVRAMANFDRIEDNLLASHLDDLMVRKDSTPDRIILTPADEETKARRKTYHENDGLILSVDTEGSSDDEVLGIYRDSNKGDQP